ncbi:hypothetical protein WN55_07025 [Dufourea novaeangliae]|uniref:Uncharacterized protein n=1 Tax=Dufourea novaeangliae TaxID=178035 RepID=A0A154PT98_DUFNO|nr:hypothetical protein WN55_07025 [Dufourea novaeangliae]
MLSKLVLLFPLPSLAVSTPIALVPPSIILVEIPLASNYRLFGASKRVSGSDCRVTWLLGMSLMFPSLSQGGGPTTTNYHVPDSDFQAIEFGLEIVDPFVEDQAAANVVFITASNVENVILATAACVVLSEEESRPKRKFWVRPSLLAPKRCSGSDLLTDLEKEQGSID